MSAEVRARLEALDAAIARGIADANAGRVKPAEDVFDRLEAKYLAMVRNQENGASPSAPRCSPPHQRPEPALVFHEEAHAIDAVLSGQGVGICSDVLVGAELASGALAVLSSVTLPGLAFHILYRDDSAKTAAIRAFADWTKEMAGQPPAAD